MVLSLGECKKGGVDNRNGEVGGGGVFVGFVLCVVLGLVEVGICWEVVFCERFKG